MSNGRLFDAIDHLVYASPDLEAGVRTIESVVGVRAAAGGRHPQWRTRNALMSLGPRRYLEIIAPDPESGGPEPNVFGLSSTTEGRLVAWAAHTRDLEGRVRRAREAGIELGPIRTGRRRKDGGMLTWRLTDLEVVIADGLVPFLIDWGDGEHPAPAAPPGVTLEAFRAVHPEPDRVTRILEALELPLEVEAGPRPMLVAVLQTPLGRVELR